jgi:hypothetical protein
MNFSLDPEKLFCPHEGVNQDVDIASVVVDVKRSPSSSGNAENAHERFGTVMACPYAYRFFVDDLGNVMGVDVFE